MQFDNSGELRPDVGAGSESSRYRWRPLEWQFEVRAVAVSTPGSPTPGTPINRAGIPYVTSAVGAEGACPALKPCVLRAVTMCCVPCAVSVICGCVLFLSPVAVCCFCHLWLCAVSVIGGCVLCAVCGYYLWLSTV